MTFRHGHWAGILLAALLGAPLLAPQAMADSMDGGARRSRHEEKLRQDYLSDANDASQRYLDEARAFRHEGRYELARQRYLQALSICADSQTLYEIKLELQGVELLLRTMR